MNKIFAKLVLISIIPTINLNYIEKSVASEINFSHDSLYLISQNSELEELKKLQEQKKKQQEDLKKKLDVINPNKNNSSITDNNNSSRFWLILTTIASSAVVGIGGLLLLRSILLQFVPQEYKQKLKTIDPSQQPWWNKPLFGANSLFNLIFSKYSKPEIPEDAITLHKNYMTDLKNVASIIKSLEQEKFNTQDFLLFLKIRSSMIRGIGIYEGLKPSTDLLQVAIKAKNSFLAIDQTELKYRGIKQQEFYQQVINILEQNLSQLEFQNAVKEKLDLSVPEVKTEAGKNALYNYYHHLELLSENDLGLKLLSLFKKYNLADYSILNRVSEIMDSLEKAVIIDAKVLIVPIMKNYEVFEKLGPIIGINENKVDPKVFANILQYLALEDRHKDSYREYAGLVIALKDWKKVYDAIILLREQFSAEEYKLPQEFREELLGEGIYNKYKSYLD